jgi:hypothetical protein
MIMASGSAADRERGSGWISRSVADSFFHPGEQCAGVVGADGLGCVGAGEAQHCRASRGKHARQMLVQQVRALRRGGAVQDDHTGARRLVERSVQSGGQSHVTGVDVQLHATSQTDAATGHPSPGARAWPMSGCLDVDDYVDEGTVGAAHSLCSIRSGLRAGCRHDRDLSA